MLLFNDAACHNLAGLNAEAIVDLNSWRARWSALAGRFRKSQPQPRNLTSAILSRTQWACEGVCEGGACLRGPWEKRTLRDLSLLFARCNVILKERCVRFASPIPFKSLLTTLFDPLVKPVQNSLRWDKSTVAGRRADECECIDITLL